MLLGSLSSGNAQDWAPIGAPVVQTDSNCDLFGGSLQMGGIPGTGRLQRIEPAP